jgi:hypothetical protein
VSSLVKQVHGTIIAVKLVVYIIAFVVGHLSMAMEALVRVTFGFRSVISIASVTAFLRPVAGGLRVSGTDQAIVASHTIAEVALNVFSAASVTVFSAKFLQLFTASVTGLTVFKSIFYRKTSVFRVVKKDDKFLASEIGSVTGVECAHF